MPEKDVEEIKEPNLEDLEEEDIDDAETSDGKKKKRKLKQSL